MSDRDIGPSGKGGGPDTARLERAAATVLNKLPSQDRLSKSSNREAASFVAEVRALAEAARSAGKWSDAEGQQYAERAKELVSRGEALTTNESCSAQCRREWRECLGSNPSWWTSFECALFCEACLADCII